MSTNPILLVEDDPDIQENLKLFLELEGYQVQTASNGQEALTYLQAKNPALLILLDLMMPVMNGYEFLEKFHEEKTKSLEDIPIILVSAANNVEQTAKKYQLPYVEKPINLELLLEKINSFCPK